MTIERWVAAAVALASVGAVPAVPTAGAAGATGAAEAAVQRTVSEPDPATCRAGRVALTFDDGPSVTSTTLHLAHALTRLDVPATFFVVGSRIDAEQRTARVLARRGFGLGLHTYDHADLTRLDDDAVLAQVTRTRAALDRARVAAPTPLVRPPYGAIDDRVRGVLRRGGWTPVLWDVDSRDWTGLTSRQIARDVVRDVRARGRGARSVVLLHDGVRSSPATAAAVPRVVRRLRAGGWCFTGLGADGRPR